MNGGALSGMQGMFGVYQKAPINGECYPTKGKAIRRKAAALRYRTKSMKEHRTLLPC